MKKIKKFLLENKTPRQTVIKNSFWLIASEVINKIVRLIFGIYVARILGPSQMGIMSYATSFIALFFIFYDWGMSPLLVRDFQQKDNIKPYISSAFTLKIFLLLICSALVLAGYFFIHSNEAQHIYGILLIIFFIRYLKEFLNIIPEIHQHREKKFATDFFENITLITLGISLVSIYKSLNSLVIAYLLTACMGILITLILVRPYTERNYLTFNTSHIPYLIKTGFPIFLQSIVGTIFTAADNVFLGYFHGTTQVGYYAIASNITGVAFGIPLLISSTILPFISKKTYGRKKIKSIMYTGTIAVALCAFIISLAGYLLSDTIIPLMLGNQFIPTVRLFKWLIWTSVIIFPMEFIGAVFVVYNRLWQCLSTNIIPLLIFFIMNLTIVKQFGAPGSIATLFITYGVDFLITLYMARKLLNEPDIIAEDGTFLKI